MKHKIRRLKSIEYWFPILFSLAIGLGVLIGAIIESIWIGMVLGLFFGAIALFGYSLKKRQQY